MAVYLFDAESSLNKTYSRVKDTPFVNQFSIHHCRKIYSQSLLRDIMSPSFAYSAFFRLSSRNSEALFVTKLHSLFIS